MWAFAFIALIDTENFGLTVLAVVVGLVFHGAMYGPQAAFLSELFGTNVRYSGVSIGYQLASIFAGGLAPIIAVALLQRVTTPATRSRSTSRLGRADHHRRRGDVPGDRQARPGHDEAFTRRRATSATRGLT